MKKFCYLLIALLAAASLFAGCKKDKTDEGTDVNVAATVSQSSLIDAIASMYSAWEENTTIPASIIVDGKTLTLAQYQYAMCQLLINLTSGTASGNMDVLSYKEAEHPDRDSYDKETIAVTNGPANSYETGATEDLVSIAKRMLAAMKEKGQVPNQTLFMREAAIAFSTNRATICIARAIAEYKATGKFPTSVTSEYLSAAATLKGFAQQLVSYLDVWDKTIGTVDADGSHCTANKNPWKDVHFIPIPYSGGYQDGTMYSEQYQPYHTITVDGVEYTASQCWEIALKGILDLVTKEGSALSQTERNTTVHTLADGKSLSEPIPSLDDWATWGTTPWYEKADDPSAINLSASAPCNLAFLQKVIPWFLTRSSQLGRIGNFQTFGDSDGTLKLSPYQGNFSSMRMFLIAVRFYKYLLDNNITDKVYTAVKDVNFDYDLYGVKMPDAELLTTSVSVNAAGEAVEAKFNSTATWTATADAAWIHVTPASGSAANGVTLSITADANTGEARTGNVTIKAGETTLTIPVTQEKYVAPTGSTLKDFATEFVKCLPVWTATVGTVDACSIHCTANKNAFENVHFLPIGEPTGNPYGTSGNQYDPKYTVWTMTVGGVTYTSAQAWEIAIKGLMNMVTSEGEAGLAAMDDRNKAFTLADNKGLDQAIPSNTAGCAWGKTPWYEGDNSGNVLVTYNGAEIKEVGLDFLVKLCAWHEVRAFIKTSGNTSPLGYIGNFQQFGTTSSYLILDGYSGQICSMRELLILARLYKSLLDNNVTSNVYTYLKDKKFDFDLYGQNVSSTDPKSIKAFAQQYVTILDVWQKTTGTINMLTGETLAEDRDKTVDVANAHYVPSTTTISVNGKTYNTADMLETAERSYLLVRGYDGTATNVSGAGKFTALTTPAQMSTTEAPATHNYVWQAQCFNEIGSTIGGVETKNGGHLMMGNAATSDGKPSSVKLDILDNFAQRHINWGITHNGDISNMCGYVGNRLAGYYGCFCAQRALVTYAFFFKYMLDNNLEDAKSISADTVFRSEEFGDEK